MTSEPDRREPLMAGWGPVLVAFAAVRVFLWVAAAGHNADALDPRAWSRWDSHHYLSIATRGYYWEVSDGHNSRYPPGTVVGDTGWMPGYPLLVRGLTKCGLPPMSAGVWLSAACALAMLRAIDRLLPPAEPPRRRVPVLLLAAFFPGFVYAHAIFPISMVVLLLAVAVRMTAAGLWTLGGLAGAAAAFTYTSGYLIGPVMGLWSLLIPTGNRPARTAWGRAVRMVVPALLPVAGLGAVLLMQRATLGRSDGLFLVQSRYHGLSGNPLRELAHLLWLCSFVRQPLGRAMWQVPATTAVWALAVGTVAVQWRKRSPTDRLLAVAAAAYWVGALTVGTAGHPWRPMALLTPFVPPLLRHLPRPLLYAILAVFVLLGWPMCGRFLDNSAV